MADQVGSGVHAHIARKCKLCQDHRGQRGTDGGQHRLHQQSPPVPHQEHARSQHQNNRVLRIDLEWREALAFYVGDWKGVGRNRNQDCGHHQAEAGMKEPGAHAQAQEQKRAEHDGGLQIARGDPELRGRVGAVHRKQTHALERHRVDHIEHGAPANADGDVDQKAVLRKLRRSGGYRQRRERNDDGETFRQNVEHEVTELQAQGTGCHDECGHTNRTQYCGPAQGPHFRPMEGGTIHVLSRTSEKPTSYSCTNDARARHHITPTEKPAGG